MVIILVIIKRAFVFRNFAYDYLVYKRIKSKFIAIKK